MHKMKQNKTFFTSDIGAMQYRCNFSCDNAIFFKHNDEAYFITDSRYNLEAKECAKNVEVVKSFNKGFYNNIKVEVL